MNIHDLIRELREPAASKIVLLVADGLGGLPLEPGGKTELESARTPNLDACVREGVCGLSLPVLPGITPGSGPGHLGLFGYDPLEFRIGRGILEALGINFKVGSRDVAVRGNFCTVDDAGRILKGEAPTTMVTLGGFARYPKIATMQEVYGVRPAALAVYPMYKGLARLVGMDVIDGLSTLPEQVQMLEKLWSKYDFF